MKAKSTTLMWDDLPGGVRVSTVQLQFWFYAERYETMIFGLPDDEEYQVRYKTAALAWDGHRDAVLYALAVLVRAGRIGHHRAQAYLELQAQMAPPTPQLKSLPPDAPAPKRSIKIGGKL